MLDGFGGSGMTGVAAQWCGSASAAYRHELETEWKKQGKAAPIWGSRRVIINDLSPAATFIAANYNTTSHGSFNACSLLVKSPFNTTIEANTFINIQNGLTVLGTFDIKDKGALCQVNDAGVNIGNVHTAVWNFQNR